MTAHQRSEETSLPSKFLEEFFVLSTDLLAIVGFDGYVKEANRACEKAFGFSLDELKARPYAEFVHPEDRASLIQVVGALQSGQLTTNYQIRLLRNDGTYKWIEWNGTLSSDRQLMYGIGRDITERKTTENSLKEAREALQDSKTRIRSVLNAIPDMIVRVSSDGIILELKPATDFPLRKPAEQLIGNSISEIFSPDLTTLYLDAIQDALATQKTHVFEHPLVMDHREEHREIRIFPIDPKQVMLMIRDITKHKKLEKMKTDLVSFASHQLRSPVAQISGFANNLLQGIAGKLNDQQTEYVGFMKAISERTLRLVGDLLSVSKSEGDLLAAQLEPVKLKDIVDFALKNCSKVTREGLTLELKELDKKIVVYADFQKTAEAIGNALENALRFTKKGSITISIRARDDFGVVEVEDTGPGIPESVFPKLFTKELIFSSNPTATGEGTGLGLYIAKKFMTLEHGDLQASSTPGKGSKFTFTIPKYHPASNRVPNELKPRSKSVGNTLIDDHR